MNKSLLLAVLLCTAVLAQSNCPSFYTKDLLQSGKNAISRGKIGGNPEYSYEFPISFPVPAWGVEIAVTTGTIGDYNPLPTYGYNYFIEANRKGTSNYIVYKLIMNNDESWTSIQLSYLACGRADMTVGNFEVPINEWVPATGNVYNVYKTLTRAIPKTNYKVAAFISGFSTTDNEFTLTVTKKVYDNDAKKLSVSFYCSANPAVLTLTITYIIYPETHLLLDISYDLTPRGEVGAYQISGPVNFQPNKRIEYNEWRVENRFLPCTGNECDGNLCVLREDCANKNGNIYEMQCIFCPPGIIPEFGKCNRKCGANQNYFNRVCSCAKGFTRKGKDCISGKTCGTNQVWSDTQNGCVCAKGFFNFNDECRQCPDGSDVTADGKSCFCKSNDKIYDTFSNTCENRCFENQQWLNSKCACIPNHCWWNKGCRRCPDNSEPNADQTACLCKSANAYYNLDTNTCVECPAGQFLTKNKSGCGCQDGFVVKNGVCTSSCDDTQVFNPATNVCDCKAGWEKGADGKCRAKCPAGEGWFGTGCACLDGYARYGTCKICPAGSVPNAQKTACVCKDINQYLNANSFVCQACIANSAPNADKSACVCNAGFVLNNGACVRDCRDPEITDVASGNCVCKNGFVRGANGVCAPRCQANEVWDGTNCLCPDGFAKYGVCKQCPVGTLPNYLRTSCICTDPNQIFLSDRFSCLTCAVNSKPTADLSKCICNDGYVSSGSNCILNCGVNEQPNNDAGRCECIFGFQKVDGKCTPRCQLNQEWNGNSCICKPGFGLFKGVCTVCPLDSTPNTQRTSCRCIAPTFYFNPATFKCEACPENSRNTDDDTKCVCNPGFEQKGAICSPTCDLNEELNVKTNQCDCKYGFLRLGPLCVERCGLNQEWDGSNCRCKENHLTNSGVCKPCPDVNGTNPKRTNCLCKSNKEIFDPVKFACAPLPIYSGYNDDYTDFVCYPGYKKENGACVSTCPVGAVPDSAGRCSCTGGYYLDANTCKKPLSCPAGSTWDAVSLACICDTRGQNIIDGQCQACGENSIYSTSSKKCICNTGFNFIGGECIVCDPRTKYNGTDCTCNLGHFGNRDKCDKCHASCSRCSGPEANQCLSCSDVSLILQNGFCSKNTPCDPGFYLGDSTCTKCTDNCIICDDIFQCQQCAIGYEITKLDISGQQIEACIETCGDGIKYQAECDDGNTVDGDGCSSQCTIEQQWSCSGGSSVQKSKCIKYIPEESILTSKGVVNLGDRVVQSVRASYLPTCLTDNECSKCFKVLKANVVDANVPILVKVNFVPFSQYQFLIEYNFQGLYVTSKFKTVIKFNEDFKGCLADDDFNQQLELAVDPAFLAKVDVEQTLTLDQITPGAQPKIDVPAAAQKILGIKK